MLEPDLLVVVDRIEVPRGPLRRFLLRLLDTRLPPFAVPGVSLPDAHYPMTKLQFLRFPAFLLPAVLAVTSTVCGPGESLLGVRLRLPVIRRY